MITMIKVSVCRCLVGKLGFNIRMLGSKVTPKIHAPFDCRMRQNSPMTIYNVKKNVSPAASFHPKEDYADEQLTFLLILDPAAVYGLRRQHEHSV